MLYLVEYYSLFFLRITAAMMMCSRCVLCYQLLVMVLLFLDYY